ncbi:zinc-binding protein, partial [Corynebacterium sp. MC-17D]
MHMEVATQDSAVDSDGDGLPDVWEREGVTLHDGTVMPLDQWGADPERPDLFLQLNWMNSQWQQAGCDTPGADTDACAQMSVASYRPHRDILQQLVDRFDQYGVNLHIDAGDTYTNIANYPTRHGGQTEAYAPYYFEGTIPGMKLVENIDTILGARAAVFRVGVIGDQMQR